MLSFNLPGTKYGSSPNYEYCAIRDHITQGNFHGNALWNLIHRQLDSK